MVAPSFVSHLSLKIVTLFFCHLELDDFQPPTTGLKLFVGPHKSSSVFHRLGAQTKTVFD